MQKNVKPRSNEAIVQAIQQGQDCMEELYSQNIKLLHYIANRYSADHDDLIQEGYLALREAAIHYDLSSEVPFSQYVIYWLTQYMWRYTFEHSTPVKIPRHKVEQIRKLKGAAGYIEAVKGRSPTDTELCTALNISKNTLNSIKTASRSTEGVSIYTPIADGVELADVIPEAADELERAEDKIQREELRKVLDPMIDSLPDRQAEIIRGKYYKGQSLSEMGAGAYTIHRQALKALRKPQCLKELKPFYDIYNIYNRAVKGVGARSFNVTWTSSTERVAIEQS